MKLAQYLLHQLQRLAVPIFPQHIASANFLEVIGVVWVACILAAYAQFPYVDDVYLKPLNSMVEKAPEVISSMWPSELEVTIHDGYVNANVKQPYFIPITNIIRVMQQIRSGADDSHLSSEDYLLVIDTSAKSSQIIDYRTIGLLTQNTFSYLTQESQSGYQSISIDPATNITLNQKEVTNIVMQFYPMLKSIYPLSVMLSISGLLVIEMLKVVTITLVVLALVITINKLFKTSVDNELSIKMSSYSISLIILINSVLLYTNIEPISISQIGLLTFLMSIIGIFKIAETNIN